MNNWSDRPICAFDLETTGRDPSTARIVSACVAVVDGSSVETRTWLLDPGVDIPAGAIAIHGITTEYAAEHGQDYAEGYEEIREALHNSWARDHSVVAFNASYDLTVMHCEGLRIGKPALVPGLVVDPYVIDRAMDKFRKGKRTLSAVCEFYGITLESAHEAEADAMAAAALARELALRFPEINDLDLMVDQAQWHAERQRDFAEFLSSQGKDVSDVNGQWPIHFVA
ncbi:DNA polymerase III subunit epsilon [Rhodococcus sp. ACPA4]|uniref:3'-5' exonuclease n=1 Tax=Rhodococcus globerulus TaxID=33008 RepID=A0ABU4C0E8_RHOGO|nr:MULTISPECIES: 3'-5' exonuclease [Rhodococcus]MDV6269980.1 3'-5' exonuclease [Rhodococcus globerulus]MDV8067029.1 3'-5' exonuclease [Rhodococcus sp. IEGM 1366]PBC37340.1 DNA polymerase III subunit epsilon [Rhodococcus sp. ACPA4]QXW05691.1 3'-5' exonuclease [Rhodococcus globerulus]